MSLRRLVRSTGTRLTIALAAICVTSLAAVPSASALDSFGTIVSGGPAGTQWGAAALCPKSNPYAVGGGYSDLDAYPNVDERLVSSFPASKRGWGVYVDTVTTSQFTHPTIWMVCDTAPVISAVQSKNFTVQPGIGSHATVKCPSGTAPWGGGFDNDGGWGQTLVTGSLPIDTSKDADSVPDNGWKVSMNNYVTTSIPGTVYALCSQIHPDYAFKTSSGLAQGQTTQIQVDCPGGETAVGVGESNNSSEVGITGLEPDPAEGFVTVRNYGPNTANVTAFAICSV